MQQVCDKKHHVPPQRLWLVPTGTLCGAVHDVCHHGPSCSQWVSPNLSSAPSAPSHTSKPSSYNINGISTNISGIQSSLLMLQIFVLLALGGVRAQVIPTTDQCCTASNNQSCCDAASLISLNMELSTRFEVINVLCGATCSKYNACIRSRFENNTTPSSVSVCCPQTLI